MTETLFVAADIELTWKGTIMSETTPRPDEADPQNDVIAPPVTWPQQTATPPPGVDMGTPPPSVPTAVQTGPPTSSNAIIALILAVVSWAVCPVVPAIIALVFAAKADREINSAHGAIAGQGLSTAAKILSWINIGLWAALILLFAVVALVAVLIAAAGGDLSVST